MIWGSEIVQQGLHEITIQPDGRVVDRMSEGIGAALNATITRYEPEDSLIQAPTLSFYALQEAAFFISHEFMSAAQQAQVVEFFATARLAWLRKSIQLFHRNVPHARIVEIPHCNHYIFLHKPDFVFDEMSRFLSS
jgi:pimeloyl-ACP methyl ester carboxylesterase